MELLEILGRIGFDWKVALANLVNFLIIFWVLKRFVFSPMRETIERRRETIAKGLEEKKEAEEVLANAQSRKEEVLEEAKREAQVILEGAKAEESEMVRAAREKAEKEAEAILKKAGKEIESDEKRMKEEFKAEAARLISLGVKRVISEDISKEKSKKFTEELVAASEEVAVK